MPNYRRDFTTGGLYFFTVVLKDRSQDYLIKYINEFRQAYKITQERYPFETVAICILPDHFHLLMQLPENDSNYSVRIGFLKSQFSKLLPLQCRKVSESDQKQGDAGIWQRRFWEHLIRNDEDLANHWDYIYYNPVKHGYVQYVKEWQFSSFHRDVDKGIYPEDWGGCPDLIIKGEM
ncbi:REP-associated tyrosine transposase [Basfia succiniciproducens]|uniref:Transposase n=1 Tax=Basfia succiniciproducens TaxID=653940 RepID=A0A1G5BL68_9PAST|nr:transposase [Basfia succiniciproducens]QIM68389.1 hypothetical protein A4G13_02775 [Basfia succiniciproducens]SCX90905.1 putative transposase [Basfia succiniciproducens]